MPGRLDQLEVHSPLPTMNSWGSMKVLFSILLLLSLVPVVEAAALETLEFDGTPPGAAQNVIKLTYRAGLMGMLLGRYRIASVQGWHAEQASGFWVALDKLTPFQALVARCGKQSLGSNADTRKKTAYCARWP